VGFSFEDCRVLFVYFLSVLIFIAGRKRPSTCPLFRTRCFNFIPGQALSFSFTLRSSLPVRERGELSFRLTSLRALRQLHPAPFKTGKRQSKEVSMASKFRVGILGATGTVGQRFIQMLERHPSLK